MTRQLHAAVPMSETPGSRLQKAEHSNEGSMSSIEFLRSTNIHLPKFIEGQRDLPRRFDTAATTVRIGIHAKHRDSD